VSSRFVCRTQLGDVRVAAGALSHGEHKVHVRLECGDLVQGRADYQLESEALPGVNGAGRELGVGFDEAFVEEDGCETWPYTVFVAELEPECGTDDECDQFLGLSATFAAEGGVGSDVDARDVDAHRGDLDVFAHIKVSVSVCRSGLGTSLGPADVGDERPQTREAELGLVIGQVLRRAGGQLLQFAPEADDVVKIQAPQGDPQPVLGGSEWQFGEDGVYRQQPVLDVLDGGVEGAVERDEVLPLHSDSRRRHSWRRSCRPVAVMLSRMSR